MDVEAARKAVQEHGGVDPAASALQVPRAQFRAFCRENGIKYATAWEYIVDTAPPSRVDTLQAEVDELRFALKQAKKSAVRDERVIHLLEDMIPAKNPMFSYWMGWDDLAGDHSPHRFVLCWSDLHAAEVVDQEAMNGLNYYDWDVMLERHERISESLFSFRKNRPYKVEGLHILGLGDMLSGDIHEELKVTNDRVLIEAALQLGLDAAEWIEGLIPHFPEITLDGIVGNHPRTTLKPAAKQAHSNFDWLVYHIISLRLAAYPTVTVRVPKSAMSTVDVYDKRILIWHGDGVRSTMPGVPWGGIVRRVKELQQNFPADYYACGHWHEANVVSQRRIWVNGSIKGPDEYGLKSFGGGQPACQLLFTFHPTRGLTDVSFLDLQ